MKVWTFLIRGGPSDFSLTLPNNPSLYHDGSITIWKMVGTQETANTGAGLIRSLGAAVTVYTEEQSKEQEAERRSLLGLTPEPR